MCWAEHEKEVMPNRIQETIKFLYKQLVKKFISNT